MNGQILSSDLFPSPNPNVSLFIVTYLSEGLKVKGLLAEPKKGGTFEGLLYLRGGIKNKGKVRPARVAQFSQEGFIVFAPFYRGNQGGEGVEDFGGMDRFDAFSGFELLKQHPRLKDNRIHIFGISRGGLMALWTAINYPEATSVVTWGGVSDIFLTYEERMDLRKMLKRVIGGTPYSKPKLYRFRSPLFEMKKLSSPLLIIHGKQDQNVSFSHALKLEKYARTLKKQVETWYFDNFSHYFPPKENRKITEAVARWMKNQ
ncbi:alpha/beta hydrolase family protein [Fervidibacillus halotolerans]|uniref:Prolyl oligopeptidase family serine peptidase n=1 Tax=Fervidibacillus halotolerans TaxID=2980027 RepID=A0A9E8LZD1_9BACI|nr:prolyl oligopeptidase family serine peptidase [Fervidibacillus halotolerans]WAA11786.1 prolyl oligopeptidase family serine peptidase [Fervidibacillus halotolerans]